MWDKAVNKCFIAFTYINDWCKICDRTIFEDTFMLLFYPDENKSQKIRDEAVDNNFLEGLKFIPDWFVTSKMIKTLPPALRQMIKYSILMRILVMPYLLVIKWIFLL